MLAVDGPADLPLTENEEEQGATDGFLAIEDLLDFSNDDIGDPIGSSFSSSSACIILTPSISPPDAASVCSIVSSPSPSPKLDKRASQQVVDNAFDSDELCVPCDDLAELEWLSNFVEESFSSNDHLPANFCLGSIRPEESKTQSMSKSFHSSSPVSVLENITAHSLKLNTSVSPSDSLVPARARSKRCRSAVCFWNTRILSAEASESILESSSTASTITAASSDSDGLPAYYDGHEDDDDYEEEDQNDNEEHDDIDLGHFRQYNQHKRAVYPSCKVKKFNNLTTGCMLKPKKIVKVVADDRAVPLRKCLHCGSTKTPQWRAGPMGPKTLCNACGVRYKSGRLCAEYRPAASPNFNESVHSNSHRKVLEMRRQRGELSSPIIAHHKLPAQFDNAQLAKTKEDLMTTT